MTVSKFLFGTGNENEIRVGFPLFDILTDREDGAASEYIDLPDGSVDAWRQDKMFTIDTEARWIPDGPGTNPVQTQLSGPVSWEEFLDWVRDGRPIRFVPDETVPDFYVDNTYLVEPRKGFGSLSTDIKRNVQLKLRNPLMSFHQAMRGIMFEYAPGASLVDPVAASFTRASAATRRGQPSTSMAAAIGASDLANVLRDRHYEGALKTALLEAARTQLVTDPENFGNWTAINVTRTAGQADPFGGTNAYKLDATAGADNRIQQVVAGFTSGTRAVLVFLRADPTSAQSNLIVTSGAVTRHQVRVTWTAGVPTLSTIAGSGTLFSVAPWGAGWYVISINADNVVASDIIQIYPAATGGTGTVYAFGANAWNATFPSSYQGPSLTVRSADAFSSPFPYKPQAMFVLADFVENELTTSFSDTRIITICDASENPQRLLLYVQTTTDNYRIFHEPSSALAVAQNIDQNPVRGDRMQVLGLLYPDGSVKIGASKNGGAEAFSAQSGADALAAAWSGQTISIGSRVGNPASSGFRAFARVKVGPLVFGGITRDTIAKALAA